MALYSGLMQIGDVLRHARQRLKLAQRPFAARAGVGQNQVARAELGGDIRLSTLERLATAADLEVMLVPRSLATVVRGMTHSHWQGASPGQLADQPLYALGDDDHLIGPGEDGL